MEICKKIKVKNLDSCKIISIRKKFRLTDQLICSSRSVSAVIAEGHGKFTYKDKINYCMMGRGSLSETWNHLIDAMDSEYIYIEEIKSYKIDIDETAKLLNGYINFLRGLNEKEKNKNK